MKLQNKIKIKLTASELESMALVIQTILVVNPIDDHQKNEEAGYLLSLSAVFELNQVVQRKLEEAKFGGGNQFSISMSRTQALGLWERIDEKITTIFKNTSFEAVMVRQLGEIVRTIFIEI